MRNKLLNFKHFNLKWYILILNVRSTSVNYVEFSTIKEHVSKRMIFGINSFLRKWTSGTKQYYSYYSKKIFFNTLDMNNIRPFYYS